jgi:hypothetical protein
VEHWVEEFGVRYQTASSSSLRQLHSAGVFGEQPVHDFLLVVKTGPLDTFEGLGKIDQTMFGGRGKNAEGARNPEPLAPSD